MEEFAKCMQTIYCCVYLVEPFSHTLVAAFTFWSICHYYLHENAHFFATKFRFRVVLMEFYHIGHA